MQTISCLIALFEQWAGEKHILCNQLPESGSNRKYYRLASLTKKAIGVINKDIKENKAFLEYSSFFKDNELHIPEIYVIDKDIECYLQQDLGNLTLFEWLSNSRTGEEIPETIISFYKSVIKELIKFQIKGKNFDFSIAYPCENFDKQSMMWDLQYFKYYFLKLAQISFNEQSLEKDFNNFTDFLLQTDTDYFMYRDFQSRNIMVANEKPFFIDYQGGRKGALQYDIASLLFDAKADLPNKIREELFDFYITELQNHIEIDVIKFKQYYYGYALIRIMQALGAYGLRGYYEKKEHFLSSIPFAVKNIRLILEKYEFPFEAPILKDLLFEIINSKKLSSIAEEFCITVNSFAYRKGIPVDNSGHGGGYVFDCRAIPNPAQYAEYKDKTGKDIEVIEFFEHEQEMSYFLNNVFNIVDQSVEKYLKRNFKHLSVNFGCTGGQHRSVYSAEALVAHLKEKFNVSIKINHTELEKKELK